MSSKGWKFTRWGDLATLEYGKSLREYENTSGDFPVYGTNGLIGYTDKPLCPFPSVIIGRKGAYRGIHYSSKPFFVIDTAFYLKPKTNNVDLLFAYYQLLTQDINSMDSGSAIPSTSREDFYNLEVKLPPLPIQRRIAGILSSLDDKIEHNRQINVTLESIAQAIFKDWIVDFNYPGKTGEMVESDLGMIPKGWRVLPLDEIANFLNGLALQKYPPENDFEYLPVIKIREMRNGITSSTDRASRNIPDEYVVRDGDLLFSWSGSLEVKFWVGGEGALNQHLFKVTSKEYPKWFCYFWILHYLEEFRKIAEDKTTTMGHIQRHHLTNALCLIPNQLDSMDKVMNPIGETIINNLQQSATLASLRDALLPRLMSGEIDL